jgi:uncharacterized membrane protein
LRPATTMPRTAGFAVIALLGIAVVVATAWAAGEVLHRVPAALPARVAKVVLGAVAAGMAVATVAAVVWGLQIHSGADGGFLATPFVYSWIATAVVLAISTGLAARAAGEQPR